MAGGNSGAGEKTEKPTHRRLEDSRKKGIVAKSMDLSGSLTILALILILPFAAASFGQGMILALKASLAQPGMTLDPATMGRATWVSVQPGLVALAFILGTAAVVGVAVNFAQVGVKVTPEAMQPKWEVLDPFKGLTRFLSRRTLFEAIKTLVKSLIFGYIAYSAIREAWPRLITLVWSDAGELASVAGSIVVTIGTRVASVWLVIAVIDYIWQKKQTDQQLMMTKDEVKREMKEQEGSPEIKGARMARARKLARGRMMESVKSADVIVTNPTHYSVAIMYDRDNMHAPMVVAKGMDYLALRIREVAADNEVPIIPNPPLARALYKQCEVGDFVPRDMFAAVAEVLAFVYRTIKKVRQ